MALATKDPDYEDTAIQTYKQFLNIANSVVGYTGTGVSLWYPRNLFCQQTAFCNPAYALFLLWILANGGFIWGFQRFDEYPYSLLGIILSIEAILITASCSD